MTSNLFDSFEWPDDVKLDMRHKIADARLALHSGAWLSAVSIALTLCDICAKDWAHDKWESSQFDPKSEWATENEKGYSINVGPHYRAFFMEFFYQDPSIPGEEGIPKLDGDMIYRLRCSFLHEGTLPGEDVTLPTLKVNLTNGSGHQGRSWNSADDTWGHFDEKKIEINPYEFVTEVTDDIIWYCWKFDKWHLGEVPFVDWDNSGTLYEDRSDFPVTLDNELGEVERQINRLQEKYEPDAQFEDQPQATTNQRDNEEEQS